MSSSIERPQPLGIFPFPAGLLLLPPASGPIAEHARTAMMRGGAPDALPNEWQFFADAMRGDIQAAVEKLAADPSPLSAYNRFVLDGDESARTRAMRDGDSAIRQLTELVAFVQGASDTLPDGTGLDGELRANVLLTRAAAAIDAEQFDQASDLLTEGIGEAGAVSPVLAAQLMAQLAQLQPQLGAASDAKTIQLWRSAINLAGDTPLPHLRGDLRVGLAIALHEASGSRRDMLIEAVKTYQSALQHGISLQETPETYAMVQNNIGLAYLTTPMSENGEKLRHAVAVQSFREALKVYTAESHPEAWASTMLNMANAFQYLPTSHPEENLINAVETYEQLLAVRNKALDPLGYARLLANQANALAHLGMFQPATEKFTEAHKLLHWHGEPEMAATVLEQLERINAQLVTANGSDAQSGGGAD